MQYSTERTESPLPPPPNLVIWLFYFSLSRPLRGFRPEHPCQEVWLDTRPIWRKPARQLPTSRDRTTSGRTGRGRRGLPEQVRGVDWVEVKVTKGVRAGSIATPPPPPPPRADDFVRNGGTLTVEATPGLHIIQ